ncbi:hypothetical protein BV898_02136 [Hypsibius exemplaris]|uniref:G-protein coupled receptors family 1 profile domain-containing protein n=1 Tax=Hypsibius exemplaris TaxID=2072580 RepID=A0A1W0X9H6_HYPEX|nr:hypothetical protein BV898_02136 [Hypsibius exemplaris]
MNLTSFTFIKDNISNVTRANCTLPPQVFFSLNVFPLIMNMLIILAQSFNLIVFHFWRQKEPFVQLHVALAWPSLLFSITVSGTQITCILPWREPLSVTLINFFGGLPDFWHTLSLVTLLSISMDRWLSVEFPGKYRLQISRKKVQLTILTNWIVTALLTLPWMILHWPIVKGFCNRPIDAGVAFVTPGGRVWKILHGPVLIGIFAVFQLRVVIIAVRVKVRAMVKRKHLRRAPGPDGRQPSVRVVGIVWTSLRANMIILFVGAVADLPYVIEVGHFVRNPTWLLVIHMLPTVQHIYSPIVYLIFFPQFRAVFRPLYGRIAECCGLRGHSLVIPSVPLVATASAEIIPTGNTRAERRAP